MNVLNARCSKCNAFRISAPTGRNGKAYCLRHLPRTASRRGVRRIQGTGVR